MPLATPAARLGLAGRLRDDLEAAGDQLRRHAAPGGAAARSAEARADRRDPQAAAAAGPAQAAPGRQDRAAGGCRPAARASIRPTATRACSRRGPATSTPSRSIPSPTARSIRSTPRPARSPISRSRRASSLSARVRSPPATPCAGSSATPRAATGADQARPYPGQADAAGPRHQSRHQHRSAHLSSRAALGREDLHGVGLLGLCPGSADRAPPAERRRRSRGAGRRPASISTR